jgi:hypothetical protein
MESYTIPSVLVGRPLLRHLPDQRFAIPVGTLLWSITKCNDLLMPKNVRTALNTTLTHSPTSLATTRIPLFGLDIEDIAGGYRPLLLSHPVGPTVAEPSSPFQAECDVLPCIETQHPKALLFIKSWADSGVTLRRHYILILTREKDGFVNGSQGALTVADTSPASDLWPAPGPQPLFGPGRSFPRRLFIVIKCKTCASSYANGSYLPGIRFSGVSTLVFEW